LIEELKKDQDLSIRDVKQLNEKISNFLKEELDELEERIESKMKNLREEFKKHSKLSLSSRD